MRRINQEADLIHSRREETEKTHVEKALTSTFILRESFPNLETARGPGPVSTNKAQRFSTNQRRDN